ncbi:hypothetical protein [Haladaptatus sp. CMSO5]|uniref:hypothetical protein n=1 Tax=Haladaptatus sp. CMSO5 TaxID=3120514 RepID=UPI002FCE3A59
MGFAALYIGLMAARSAPARGYEISIYDATPVAFWVCIGLATFIALAVSFYVAPESNLRKLAVVLAISAIVAVAALPIVRGYFFVGAGDSLTHLGWMKDIGNGVLNPVNFLYPGIHTSALFIERVAGMPLERATEFLVLAYFVVFIVFVGLTVQLIAKTKYALVFGVFSALLALPINNISVHLQPHPSTEAILFVPVVLYLTVRYLTNTEQPLFSVGPVSVAPTGILLAIVLPAILFIHPQVTANVILIYASIAFVQFFLRQLRSEHPISQHRPLYLHTTYLITIFVLWAPRNPRASNTVDIIINALLYGSSGVNAVSQRSSTLSEIGGSLTELFFKLFFVSLIFGALAALLMSLSLRKKFAQSFPFGDGVVKYFTLAMFPLAGMFLLFSLLQSSTQRFRYIGFVMVLLTILGAIMLAWGFDWLSKHVSTRRLKQVAVIAFVLMLPVSTITMFASPYIYQPSGHVSEMQMNGYGTAFSYQPDAIPVTGVQQGSTRYVHAIFGTPFVNENSYVPGADSTVQDEVFANGTLLTYYDESRYIMFSETTLELELDVYKGVRYPAIGFDYLETTPDIAKVHTNGNVRVFLLHEKQATNQPTNSTASA